MEQFPADGRPREKFLSFMLAAMVISVFSFLLMLSCGGLAVAVIAALGGNAALCLVNYLVWGRAILRATAGEREDAEFQALLEDEGWNRPPEPREEDFD